MTTMPKEWSRAYMAQRRAGLPRKVRDRSATWPGLGHCVRCHMQTGEAELCSVCRWEIETRRPSPRNEVDAA